MNDDVILTDNDRADLEAVERWLNDTQNA